MNSFTARLDRTLTDYGLLEEARDTQEAEFTIRGIPFVLVGMGQDTGKCLICGTIFDCGYELRAHAKEHEPGIWREEF